MEKPELKDYNLDEKMIEIAKKKIIFIYIIYEFIVILIPVCTIIFIKDIFLLRWFFKDGGLIFTIYVIYCYFIILVTQPNNVIYKISKYGKILDKYEKYKNHLDRYSYFKDRDNNKTIYPNNNSISKSRLLKRKEDAKNIKKKKIKNPSDNNKFKESILTEREIVNKIFVEGGKTKVRLNKYERNPRARKICINYYGCKCYICGISLEKEYGKIAVGFIHVHHIIPISQIGENYVIDPLKDLIPICPNCHSIIHMKNPPLTVEELKKIIKN